MSANARLATWIVVLAFCAVVDVVFWRWMWRQWR